MLTINSIDPILISFTVPGQHLLQIAASQKQGPIPVLAEQDTGQPPAVGTLVFIDNTVVPTTGLIRLKAQFANDARYLWPGQLINVRRITSYNVCYTKLLRASNGWPCRPSPKRADRCR